jgi:hypothetical protein
MHARIEQLLSIRDGDPVDAAIAEHVGRCTSCAEQLRGLSLMRERLQSLPQLDPPDASWERIQAQLQQARTSGRSRFLGHVVAAAVVAGIALTLVAGVMISRQAAQPVVASQSTSTAAGSTSNDSDEAKRVADLVAQSQHLDYLLQALPERPQIERVSTAATIDTLEERIQWLDVQLSQTPDPQLSDTQARRLWRERVELMDSLVKVRYAEAGRASF